MTEFNHVDTPVNRVDGAALAKDEQAMLADALALDDDDDDPFAECTNDRLAQIRKNKATSPMGRYGPALVAKGIPVVPTGDGLAEPVTWKGREYQPGKIPMRWNGSRWLPMAWAKVVSTEKKVKGWSGWPNCNVGIPTRTPCEDGLFMVGIDVDVNVPGLSPKLRERLRAIIGRSCTRFGRGERFLVVARSEERLKHRGSRAFTFEGVEGQHRVEFVLNGQFVAFGTHPGTKKPYRWEGGDPASVNLDDMPLVTVETLDQIAAAVEEELKAAGGVEVEGTGGKGATASGGKRFPIGHPATMAPDPAQVIEALEYLPNDFPTYPEAFPVVAAIVAAFGRDEAHYEHFENWWLEWPGNSADEARLKWDSLDETENGYRYLFERAAVFGFPWAAHDFEGVELPPEEPEEPQEPAKAPVLSYEELKERAESIKRDDAETVSALLTEIARADLKPTQEDSLTNRLARKGFRKPSLRKQLDREKAKVAGPVVDDGTFVVDQFLKRIGRGNLMFFDKKFWMYDGKVWGIRPTEWIEGQVLPFAAAVYKRRSGEGHHVDDVARLMGQAAAILRRRVAVLPDALGLDEAAPAIINVENHEIHLHDDGSFELRKHDPDNKLKSLLPIEYDPEAKAPRFLKMLEEIFGPADDEGRALPPRREIYDSEEDHAEALERYREAEAAVPQMVQHWLEIMAYSAQPRRWIKSFLLLEGAGNNGKSTLLDIMQAFIGTANIHRIRIGKLGDSQFAYGSLPGKLLVVDDDVPTGITLPDEILKQLSEEKHLTSEKKFANEVPFTSTALPILSCNILPALKDVSDAIRSRAYVVPFRRKFHLRDERALDEGKRDVEGVLTADPGLRRKIIDEELPGILNLILEAWARLRQRGKFEEPRPCLVARDEWLRKANPLVGFVEDRMRRIRKGEKSITTATLHEAFGEYLDDIGSRYSLSQEMLAKRLDEEFSMKQRKSMGVMVMAGWTVDSPESRESRIGPED